MGDTNISWTDKTWNPVRGCSRVSTGCTRCYAERVAVRFSGPGQPYEGLANAIAPRDLLDRVGGRRGGWTREVRFVPEHLADPLRWKKPQRIFVNSMSDLFHEKVTNEQIAAVFGVMAAAPRHTFMILTKRAKRMREWFAWAQAGAFDRVVCHADDVIKQANPDDRATFTRLAWAGRGGRPCVWPLPNVWLGVSTENQAAADERIPDLLCAPAAIHFISAEPLLGPIDAARWLPRVSWLPRVIKTNGWNGPAHYHTLPAVAVGGGAGIDWVVAGCESGPGTRPCDVAWLRSLRDQCAETGTAFFLKQAAQPGSEAVGGPLITPGVGSKRKASGVIELPYLDGVQHKQFPDGGSQ